MKIIFLTVFILQINVITAQQVNIDSTVISNKSFVKNNPKKVVQLIIPATLITYGILAQNNYNSLHQLDISTRDYVESNFKNPFTKIDNYTQWLPAAAVYALNAAGIKGKNNWRDITMLYALSNIISTGVSYTAKNTTKVERPDGSSNNSFPSGHTTTAFVAATFLWEEYKDVSPWYGVAGYAIAATTGALRVYNNRHWVSDVVAGAGLGILSTKLAYWIYPSIKRKLFKDKASHAMILPFYQNNGAGIAMIYNFAH
jgi:membrane-associated phospholipid phosphatase